MTIYGLYYFYRNDWTWSGLGVDTIGRSEQLEDPPPVNPRSLWRNVKGKGAGTLE
jgi:hypothetical protein